MLTCGTTRCYLVVPQVKLSNSRQPSFCGCGSRHPEQTANYWRRRCKFTVNFLSTVRTFFTPAIISWCSLLTSLNQWSLQWLCHLGHFKNCMIDWLIDWLVYWFIDLLIDCFIDLLIYWLIHCCCELLIKSGSLECELLSMIFLRWVLSVAIKFLFIVFTLIADYQHYVTYALEQGSSLYGRYKVSVGGWSINNTSAQQ